MHILIHSLLGFKRQEINVAWLLVLVSFENAKIAAANMMITRNGNAKNWCPKKTKEDEQREKGAKKICFKW